MHIEGAQSMSLDKFVNRAKSMTTTFTDAARKIAPQAATALCLSTVAMSALAAPQGTDIKAGLENLSDPTVQGVQLSSEALSKFSNMKVIIYKPATQFQLDQTYQNVAKDKIMAETGQGFVPMDMLDKQGEQVDAAMSKVKSNNDVANLSAYEPVYQNDKLVGCHIVIGADNFSKTPAEMLADIASVPASAIEHTSATANEIMAYKYLEKTYECMGNENPQYNAVKTLSHLGLTGGAAQDIASAVQLSATFAPETNSDPYAVFDNHSGPIETGSSIKINTHASDAAYQAGYKGALDYTEGAKQDQAHKFGPQMQPSLEKFKNAFERFSPNLADSVRAKYGFDSVQDHHKAPTQNMKAKAGLSH